MSVSPSGGPSRRRFHEHSAPCGAHLLPASNSAPSFVDPLALYVPGHGDTSGLAGLAPYVDLPEDVGMATRAVKAGIPVAEAAPADSLPESLGQWAMFLPRYYEVAFGAWEWDLRGGE